MPMVSKELFLDWLQRSVHPQRAAKVESLIRQMRGGKLYDASYEARRRGKGRYVDQISQTFDVFCRRYGLNSDRRPMSSAHFRPPLKGGQMSLFG